MDLYQAIQRRYSCRSYQSRGVEQDKLDRILAAGCNSPSAKNRQARKFVVIRDTKMRQAIGQLAEQTFVADAPVIIAVVGTAPEYKMFCGVCGDPVDCAIAIDHMVLAATAEGLGSCWIGHFKQNECKKLLGVPDNMEIIELLLLGYAADSPKPRSRKSVHEVVRNEKFA